MKYILSLKMHTLNYFCNIFYANYLFFFFFTVIRLQLSQYFAFALLHPDIPCSHSQSPHCYPYSWVIHTCSLTSPFPFFPPLSPSPLATVSPFHISCSDLLSSSFCSLDSSYKWDQMVFAFYQLAYYCT